MLDRLISYAIVVGLIMIGLLLVSCAGSEPTPTMAPTDTPGPPPTSLPTQTPIPPPIVTARVEEQTGEIIPISAGDRATIELDIQSIGDFIVSASADRGRTIKLGEGIYEYAAPVEGGLDTVTFSVTGSGGTTVAKIDFRVISVRILSPEQNVPCPNQALQCGFTVSGSSSGLNEEMKIVVFVNPKDPDIAPWWPYAVTEVDDDGNWEREVKVREDRGVFAGYEFAMQALVIPADRVPVLPRSLEELPAEDDLLGASQIVSLITASDRPQLGKPRYPEQVTIDSPSSFTRNLPHNVPVKVSGSARGVPDDLEIWTLVYPPNGLYYPQNQTLCPEVSPAIRTGDQWEAPNNNLGGEGALQYDIVVVVAEPGNDTSESFRDFLDTGCKTGEYPGIPADELPEDLGEEAAITVVAGE